ncbi:Glutamine amidotransferase subunit pdxT [Fusobacterium varium]|nr:Glutamine amidotransferase subunit pdxT [Fusobacterium varium]
MKIGILALQGAFLEHKNILDSLKVDNCLVKTKEQLEDIDGIILPGGESTAMGKLLRDFNILEPLKEKIKNGLPVFGTCSGMILLAEKLSNSETVHLGVMGIEVKRNAYGRQLGSFEIEEDFKGINKKLKWYLYEPHM